MAQNEKPVTKETIIKSQANYKGSSHHDLVKVTIEADGSFYKKGDVDFVHPATAEILKAKGLISKSEKVSAKESE